MDTKYLKKIPVVFVLMCSVFILTYCEGPRGPEGPAGPGLSWETAVAAVENGVYIIGIIQDGDDYVLHIGTGWAISSTQIITNAHVAYGIYDVARLLDDPNNRVVAVKNGTFATSAETHSLIECAVHIGYNNFNPLSYDFAVFTVNPTQMGDVLTVVDDNTARALKAGMNVGTLGFPGELSSPDMDAYQPIATFKNGTISAMRPFNQITTASNSSTNYVLQYNLSTTGGTSGSPVFNISGNVVAINNAGIEVVVPDIDGFPARVPLGELSFGIRIDARSDITTMPYQSSVSNFLNEDPASDATLSSGQYRITLDWNSGYDLDLWLVFNGISYMTGYIDDSRAYIYPFCVHHGDSYEFGPEIATLMQLSESVSIYAQKWTSYTDFVASAATCDIESSSGSIASVSNPPAGSEDFWFVGTISPTGQFTLQNQLTDTAPYEATVSANKLLLEEIGKSVSSDAKLLKRKK